MVNRDDLSTAGGHDLELEFDELCRVELVEAVALGNVARSIELRRLTVPTGNDAAALARGLIAGVGNDRLSHLRGKGKRRPIWRRNSIVQRPRPPAIAGMIPTSSPALSVVCGPSASRTFWPLTKTL